MIDDIRAAFTFLTVLPISASARRKPARSVAWFPLVGLCIGVCLVSIGRLSSLDRDLSAFLILLVWVAISGGLHLDGFGDGCDGLLACVEPSERRRIMKDPHAGVWAVAGLMLLLLGKWLAIRSISPEWLAVPPVLGRWAMVWAVYHFPSHSDDGFGAAFRQGLGRWQVLIASATCLILVTSLEIAVLWLLTCCFTMFLGRWAVQRLGGGLNGDVYGAICELSELLCLLALGIIYG